MDEDRQKDIDRIFVNLGSEYEQTSDEDTGYNCIAHALYDNKQWWWPTPRYACYWPPGVPRNNDVDTVAKIFEIHGYVMCDSTEPEPGFEKVVLYERPDSGVEHVARQLQDGRWTSKLGEWEDIRHERPESISCEDYGNVARVMKRRRKEWDAPETQGEQP